MLLSRLSCCLQLEAVAAVGGAAAAQVTSQYKKVVNENAASNLVASYIAITK